MMDRNMMDRKSKVTEVLEKHQGEKHVVILHNYPDPDAIASAFAHRLISEQYDIQVDIIYTGKISHSQNIALVKIHVIILLPFDYTMPLTH